MESIPFIFLALVGIPLLGFIVSTVLILSAKKELELEENQPIQPLERQNRTAKLLILLSVGGTKVIYGFVQGFLLLLHSGALSGVKDAIATLNINLTLYCAVCAVSNLITVLADGVLAAGSIKNGALTVPEAFSRSVLKVMLPEIIAILGLLYAMLTIMH